MAGSPFTLSSADYNLCYNILRRRRDNEFAPVYSFFPSSFLFSSCFFFVFFLFSLMDEQVHAKTNKDVWRGPTRCPIAEDSTPNQPAGSSPPPALPLRIHAEFLDTSNYLRILLSLSLSLSPSTFLYLFCFFFFDMM